MKSTQLMIAAYIRKWPRTVYNLKDGNQPLESVREKLRQKPGIYILYKSSGEPYYVGKAQNLWVRIRKHATNQNSKHYHQWTHFSAFIVNDIQSIKELEGLIIAAFDTAAVNSAKPRMKKVLLPKDAQKKLAKLSGNIA
jgi:hypothetical protein